MTFAEGNPALKSIEEMMREDDKLRERVCTYLVLDLLTVNGLIPLRPELFLLNLRKQEESAIVNPNLYQQVRTFFHHLEQAALVERIPPTEIIQRLINFCDDNQQNSHLNGSRNIN